MPVSTKTQQLLRLAKAQGLVTAKDASEAGVPRVYLRRLCDQGLLDQVDRGLYRLPDSRVSELHTLAEVSKRAPRAVICLLSALEVHRMTTEMPHAVWVLIARHGRAPKFVYPRLEVVRASGPALHHGVETRAVDGVTVQLTTPAKTVADCFRFRRHVGLEVALAALRDYLGRSRGARSRRKATRGIDRSQYTIDALVSAARVDRVYAVMRPYLEALA